MSVQETFYQLAYESLATRIMGLSKEVEKKAKYKDSERIKNQAVPMPEYITYKDKKVVQYLADGFTAITIAKKEDKSPRTIQAWIDQVHRKTGATKSTTLVALFFRNGWIQ